MVTRSPSLSFTLSLPLCLITHTYIHILASAESFAGKREARLMSQFEIRWRSGHRTYVYIYMYIFLYICAQYMLHTTKIRVRPIRARSLAVARVAMTVKVKFVNETLAPHGLDSWRTGTECYFESSQSSHNSIA